MGFEECHQVCNALNIKLSKKSSTPCMAITIKLQRMKIAAKGVEKLPTCLFARRL
jgi:hypothetical protein